MRTAKFFYPLILAFATFTLATFAAAASDLESSSSSSSPSSSPSSPSSSSSSSSSSLPLRNTSPASVKLESESNATSNSSEIPKTESSELSPVQTIDKKFLATWRLEKSENFEEFLKELGVGYFTRKVAAMTKQIVTYFQFADGDYGIKVSSRVYDRTIKFQLNREFWDEAPGGIKVRSIFSVNGDSLVQIMYSEKTAKITRRISGDKMLVESRIGDVICNRIYKRIN